MLAGMIGAGIQTITGLAELGSGLFGKNRRINKFDEQVDKMPKFQIPQEAGEQLGDASSRLNAELDELQKLRQDLFTQKANTVQNAQNASGDINDLLAMSSSADANMSNALINAQVQGAQQRDVRRKDYYNALTNMQEFRQLQYETNELAPWKMKLDNYQAESERSRNMIFKGAGQVGSGLISGSALGIQGGLSKSDGFFGSLFGK
jgi:hypothetical protein|tara:strand:+ start:576 stop:1193 length:618 start_codon:yes stop_codon:yes gene_type:complete